MHNAVGARPLNDRIKIMFERLMAKVGADIDQRQFVTLNLI